MEEGKKKRRKKKRTGEVRSREEMKHPHMMGCK
jgi:hypothetical protein